MTTTRTGKIARLPKIIREELNRRLENGELAKTIVTWLNQLPEVQKLITDQFGGHAIRAQNISEWRKGGYLDWQRYQLLREQTHWTAEQAAELGVDTTGKSVSIAEDIATIISAELAIHVQALGEIKNQKQRFRQFRHLARELSRLRRDDQRFLRTQLRHPGYLHLAPHHTVPAAPPAGSNPNPEAADPSSILDPQPSTHSPVGRDSVEPKLPPAASKSEPATEPQPSPLPSAGGASVPASRTQPATCAGEAIQPATPAETPAPRASVPDCGSPLPTSETPRPATLAPVAQPVPNSLTPKPLNFQTAPPVQSNPTKTQYKVFSIPMRGRRFRWIEG